MNPKEELSLSEDAYFNTLVLRLDENGEPYLMVDDKPYRKIATNGYQINVSGYVDLSLDAENPKVIENAILEKK